MYYGRLPFNETNFAMLNVIACTQQIGKRVTIINSSNELSTKYGKDLQVLVKAWATARVKCEVEQLESFALCLNETSEDYNGYTLFTLQQTLQLMQNICGEGIKGSKSFSKVISDVDMLMNQLIRSNKLKSDPFLNECSTCPKLLSHCSEDRSQCGHSDNKKHRSIKIAIIDDEHSVGMAMQATLEQFAFDVSYFESISHFETALKRQIPDLVLLDVVMPKVTPEQVFLFAKQLSERGIKVISCSSLFTFDTRLKAVRAGVSDYAVKPINPYLLVEKIYRALKRDIHKRYQVVLLDDQQSTGEFYQAVFSQVDVDFHYFSSAESLIAAMEHLQPDLFLLDRIMPSVNGLEVAAMIRQDAKYDFSPIVFLTADEQLDTKLKVVSHGADDLIAKNTPAPLVLQQVLARLERASFIKSFVSKDPLTGVLNHGQIVEHANHQIRMNKRQSSNCALVMLDVDHFKQVNDQHGHSTGDLVLNGLGQLLKSSLRDTDYVGRYGGEEFVLLFIDCTKAQALIKMNSILDTCSKMQFVQSKPDLRVSFSAGVVALEEYKVLSEAISEADRLLYLAKHAGRNQVVS